jgi:hypothetical protein
MSGKHGAVAILDRAEARLWNDTHNLMEAAGRAVAGGPQTIDQAGLDAVHALLARLKLYRAAGTTDSDPMTLGQLLILAQGLPGAIRMDCSGLDPDTAFPAKYARILLNILLLTVQGLPSGGVVRLAGTACDLFIRIDGSSAAWPAGLGLCLADSDAATNALVEPGGLQMGLTALLARQAEIRLSLLIAPVSGSQPPILRLGG